ncbi:aromatic compound dioxygenase [Rostrohypoxylon terebratum]|nr:aromatic compound dioxygenase [Rostrohypoxylon terebratum]
MGIAKKDCKMNGHAKKPKYDPEFTDKVITATGPNAHDRLKQVMPSLLRHLHDFAREVDLTIAELMVGIELINDSGRMSTDKRNETLLLADVLGLESLADEITSKLLSASSKSEVTPSAVLGPFYRANAPLLPNGSSILSPRSGWYAEAVPKLAHISGRVLVTSTGKPIPNATLDVWMAGPNGLYEQQDDEQPDMNLRGRFRTDEHGRYDFYAIRMTPYPIPGDGPAGRLLGLLDRHPYRPGHIHFIVSAEGYRTLTTQLLDKEDMYSKNDTVFASKDELQIKFERREGDEKAKWMLEYDFTLGEM